MLRRCVNRQFIVAVAVPLELGSTSCRSEAPEAPRKITSSSNSEIDTRAEGNHTPACFQRFSPTRIKTSGASPAAGGKLDLLEIDVKGTPEKAPPTLSCAFCGKPQREVRKLIAGPTVYICDECINLCCDIIAEDIHQAGVEGPKTEPGASQPPDRDRLLDIANGLRSAANIMRRTWTVEDKKGVLAIQEMGDRIDALGEVIRLELAR
jgi:hypothetical protein